MIQKLINLIRGDIGARTIINSSIVESGSLEVPYYAENWGSRSLAGGGKHGVLCVVVPDQSARLHGFELQLYSCGNGEVRVGIYFCPRPPLGTHALDKAVARMGLSALNCHGCPLGKRLEFFQKHLARGIAGCGTDIEFGATRSNLERFIHGLRNDTWLISSENARAAVADFMVKVLITAEFVASDHSLSLPGGSELHSSQLPSGFRI